MATILQTAVNSPYSDRLKAVLSMAPRLLDVYFFIALRDVNDCKFCSYTLEHLFDLALVHYIENFVLRNCTLKNEIYSRPGCVYSVFPLSFNFIFSVDLCTGSPAYVKICYNVSRQNIFLWGIDYIFSNHYALELLSEPGIWKYMKLCLLVFCGQTIYCFNQGLILWNISLSNLAKRNEFRWLFFFCLLSKVSGSSSSSARISVSFLFFTSCEMGFAQSQKRKNVDTANTLLACSVSNLH